MLAARKIVLPTFSRTEPAGESDIYATCLTKGGTQTSKSLTYIVRPKHRFTGSVKDNDKNATPPRRFDFYPVVLHHDGSPWPEANLWILSSLETKENPVMSTYASIAEDLAAFLRYIEEFDIDWLGNPPGN